MRYYVLCLVATVGLLDSEVALARKWTDDTGTKTIEADFVDLDEGVIRLRLASGRIAEIDIDRLSLEDRQFADEEYRRLLPFAPELSPAGEMLLAEIVEDVRQAAKKFPGTGKNDPAKNSNEPLLNAILAACEPLIKLEGTRRVQGVVIARLLDIDDRNLQLTALDAASRMEEGAVNVLPAYLKHVDDEDKLVAYRSEYLIFDRHSAGHTFPLVLQAFTSDSPKQFGIGLNLANRSDYFPAEQAALLWETLGKMVLDKNRTAAARILAAQTMAGIEVTPPSVYQGQDYSAPQPYDVFIPEPTSADRPELNNRDLCRKLVELLPDSEPLVNAAIVRFADTYQPELLKDLPSGLLLKMIDAEQELPPAVRKEMGDAEVEWVSPREALERFLARHPRSGIQLPADDILRLLRSEEPYVRSIAGLFAAQNVDALLAKPEFLKLLDDPDEELRQAALVPLATPGDTSFSALPEVKLAIESDQNGKLQKLTVNETGVTKLADLSKVVLQQKPQPTRSDQAEKLLAKLAQEPAPEKSGPAINALLGRGTPASVALVRKLAQDSPHESTRGMAINALLGLSLDSFEEDDAAKAKRERRDPFTVSITIQGPLRLREFVRVLQHLQHEDIFGLRWIFPGEKGRELSEIEFMRFYKPPVYPIYPEILVEIGADENDLRIRQRGKVPLKISGRHELNTILVIKQQMAQDNPPDLSESIREFQLPPSRDEYIHAILLSPSDTIDCYGTARILESVTYESQGVLGRHHLVSMIVWFVENKNAGEWYVRGVPAAKK